jgi:hypothetical protein
MIDISIIVASNKPSNLKRFLDYAIKTCSDPKRIEFVIGVNRDNRDSFPVVQDLINFYQSNFTIIPLDNPDGYFGLGYVYDACVMGSDPDSYFIQICNDKLMFKCEGWDDKYMSYRSQFDDDIFVVRVSRNKNRAYPSNGEAKNYRQQVLKADSYRLYTKKIYFLLEGHGDYWSTDTWHEPVLQILLHKFGINRQVVCNTEIFHYFSESPSPKNYPNPTWESLILDKYWYLTFERIAEKIYKQIKK